ncbi:MAG TPA: hypothetical protein VGR72_01955 [Candidatus Acidoferrales bacterium]|nr:hypothetical protein [Candidatus Acidoferrales bacterium]
MLNKMRAGMAVAAVVMLVPALAPVLCAQDKQAQDNNETSVRGQEQFATDFSSGGHVRLYLCSSGVEISGTNDEKIQVHLKAEHSEDISHVRVSFKKKGDTGKLEISGCPHNNFEMDLRIPQNSDLYARMFAGEMNIHGVTGNKDVQIHAGDMSLALGDASQYGNVELSVTAGDLDAGAFNVQKDGLFRSWHRYASGKYSLYAHVGAGDLTLQ